MFTQEVNVEALYRATELMFGEQASMILAKLADVIDTAMADGYEQGLMDGQEKFEAAANAAFDTGYTHGHADGAAADDVSQSQKDWEDGYVEGVKDVRAQKKWVDSIVDGVIARQAADDAADYFDALDEYDAANVQDSGDEA